MISALLVLLLAGSLALSRSGVGDASDGTTAIGPPMAGRSAAQVGGPLPTATAAPAVVPESTNAADGPPSTSVPAINLPTAEAATGSGDAETGALLPTYRILAFYGHPGSDQMGILGEHGMTSALELLQQQAAAFELADPSRPVMLAFELIASVAQPEEGIDGDYLLHTRPQRIDAYVNFAAEHDIQLILDVQIGRSTVADEIEAVRPWLELPHVHLALDPEFAVADGETPGVDFGGIDAADIAYAQETLATIAAEHNLPPKLLVVHQFVEGMIRNADELAVVPGVQLVIDFDGWGAPDNKLSGYNQFIRDRPIQFAGLKLFYRQDSPLMSPEQVLALSPAPDFVVYQ
jgi:hypothetical protein